MNNKKNVSRRNFLKLSAATVALPTIGLAETANKTKRAPATSKLLKRAVIPKHKGQRVVIVGAGWSGLTQYSPAQFGRNNTRYNRIDKKSEFDIRGISNSWLANQVSLDFLTHSFYDAAYNNNYLFFNASVLGVDRTSKQIFTDSGIVDYDYLVLAPGIEYDYTRIGVDDPELQFKLSQRHPGGFVNSSEIFTIKRKIHTFKGGTFIINVPTGEYRCTAAPYERACMIAAVFKKRRINAKLLLLDMNPDIRIEKAGFERAFSELYKDQIEYLPSSEISSVNLEEKTISTDFDDYQFDDALIYPPIRASSMLETANVANLKTPQKVANTDPFKYNVIGDEFVYVTGDSRSQPFSKGGHTAHSEAQYVSELIAAHSKGKEINWRSPQTMCFSAIDIDPLEAMSIITFYKYNKHSHSFAFDRTHMVEKWDAQGGQASLAWAEGMYKDMFYT